MALVAHLQLQKGQQLKVWVEEVRSGGVLIVSHEGRLFRVQNNSNRQLQMGDSTVLVVNSVDPVEFKFLNSDRFERTV